jgi:hypothetical protein
MNMQRKSTISIIVLCIALLSAIAATIGIFFKGGPGPSSHISVRGQEVKLYGKGVYHQMSAEVAPQGIAQDIITLFVAIPFLLVSLYYYRKESLRAKIFLTGVLGYFLVTYLFFSMMAMYNSLFLLWVLLLSLSFYGFVLSFFSIFREDIASHILSGFPAKGLGLFLIFTSISIALLWLSIVLPPALTFSIPKEVEHYTTLVVQALDLSILLPAAFISGILLLKRKEIGYKLSLVYIVFLAILMTALTSKVLMMASLGYTVIPVIFIIPLFNLLSIYFTLKALRHIK